MDMKSGLFVMLFCLAATAIWAEPISQGERDRALSALHGTRKQFIDIVSSITPTQWNYKPSPNSWSIAEIAEHLVLTDRLYPGMTARMLKTPATPEQLKAAQGKDATVLATIPNREKKAQAPDVLVPKRSFATPQEAISAFKQARDTNLAYIRTTQDSLRNHTTDHMAVGTIDLYQWHLLLAAHTERHLAQMREVMAQPGFPK